MSSGLKFLTGDHIRYRDRDNANAQGALDFLVFPNIWPRFKRKNRSSLMHGKPDCFSLLPVELRLMIFCFLATNSVEAVRQANGRMVFVPLEGTCWLSRLSETEYCHIPRHLAQLSGEQKPGDVPQWFLALQEVKMRNKTRLRIIGRIILKSTHLIAWRILTTEHQSSGISNCVVQRAGTPLILLVQCHGGRHHRSFEANSIRSETLSHVI